MPLSESLQLEFTVLCNRTSHIHQEWQMYRFLFSDTQDNIDIFNKVDGSFFFTINHLFLEHFCMFICRLGDPDQQRGNKNLTLETLVEAGAKKSPTCREALVEKLNTFRKETKKVRDLRNKLYGHTDYVKTLDRNAVLYSRKDMETALKSLREFMNTFREEFELTRMSYEGISTYSNGESLVHILKCGLEREDKRYG